MVVSIVIVCMNNLKNLYLCLDSIKKNTNVDYEVFVVAYLFSKENLQKAKSDYDWVNFIESDEIRGFSENNNLALRQAKGEYCFVVNDDTEMRMPVIDQLVETIKRLPEDVAIVSPKLINPDGSSQVCGRAYLDWWINMRSDWGFKDKQNIAKYCNKQGVFQSYNIVGAAFLIKTELFRKIGWFDETYFFCPEDIAVSDTLNRLGYKCYVNADVEIIHYEGMSGKSLSMVQTATRPAHAKGGVIFYSHGNRFLFYFLSVYYFVHFSLRFIYHRIKGLLKERPNVDYILSIGDMNVCRTILTKKTPKEIFIECYNKLKK
ncbi:MAG: glycosyltransferase family 2 protein [Paludibacteraceae bacterium]|nr:glycosyltransferase family 2 protein [Paludibacteraceae bacterium]